MISQIFLEAKCYANLSVFQHHAISSEWSDEDESHKGTQNRKACYSTRVLTTNSPKIKILTTPNPERSCVTSFRIGTAEG